MILAGGRHGWPLRQLPPKGTENDRVHDDSSRTRPPVALFAACSPRRSRIRARGESNAACNEAEAFGQFLFGCAQANS